MATYTRRTCTCCGLRDIQPRMIQTEKMVLTGRSKTGVNGATVLGAAMGSKKSARSLESHIFNAGQRDYYRKRKVWMCQNCYNQEIKENKEKEKKQSEDRKHAAVSILVWVGFIAFALILFNFGM